MFPANSVGTIPDSWNYSELPETLPVVSDIFSSVLYHLLDHSLDVLTCHHTLKRVTLGYGSAPDMVETISLEPIDHSWVLGDRSGSRASTKTTFVHSINL